MLQISFLILGLVASKTLAQNVSPLDNQILQMFPTLPFQENNSTIEQGFTLETLMQISQGTEKFSLEIFKKLAEALSSHAKVPNFIISPFSIWSLLILTAEGARGTTYKQLQEVLGLPNDLTRIREGYHHIQKSLMVNTSTIELAVNQVMFTDINRPVERDYEDILMRVYKADIVPVDFHNNLQAYSEINDYVERKTNGKIRNIVQPQDLYDLQMVLISAIFFKGQWKFPFEQSLTKEESFFDENGTNIGTVNMMYQKGAYGYVAHADLLAHVLELPYGNEDRLAMLIFLPHKGVSLTTIIENIGNIGIIRVMADIDAAKIKYEDDEVEVYLPRIKIASDFTLNVILERMGLCDIFDSVRANLTGIASRSPYLSRIIHKAKIEVTEEGTTASAITAGMFVNKNSPSRFYANRPFMFLIIEKKSKLILFTGQVTNPTINKF